MRSDKLKTGPSRAPARAMLKGAGFSDADLERPLVGIANTWTEVTPCNVHLRALAESVKAGVRAAGGTPIQFTANTMSVAITLLGMSPMGANEVAAADPAKHDVAKQCGELVMDLIRRDVKPR